MRPQVNNPEVTENLRERAESQRRQIQKMQAFLKGYDPEWWQRVVVDMLERRKDRLQADRLNNYLKMSQAEFAANSAMEIELDYFSEVPTNYARALESLQEELAKLDARIEARKNAGQ